MNVHRLFITQLLFHVSTVFKQTIDLNENPVASDCRGSGGLVIKNYVQVRTMTTRYRNQLYSAKIRRKDLRSKVRKQRIDWNRDSLSRRITNQFFLVELNYMKNADRRPPSGSLSSSPSSLLVSDFLSPSLWLITFSYAKSENR